MNYFEFYGLNISLKVDQTALKKSYYRKSMALHPDQNINANEAEVMEQSAMNNNAYKILKDDALRLKYILDLWGNIDETDQMPQDFLMEMMDINEQVMELQFDFDASKQTEIIAEVDRFEDSIKDDVLDLFDQDNLDLTDDPAMKRLKDYHYKSKYLRRLKENLSKISSEHS